VPNPITQNQYYARGDHIFRDSDKVFVRVALDRSTYVSGSVNPNFPFYQSSEPTNIASQYIHTFGPRMMNELRFGLNIANDDQVNPRTNTNFDIDSLGIGNIRVVGDNNRKLTPRETGVPSGVLISAVSVRTFCKRRRSTHEADFSSRPARPR
jgi:hypothetical protein